MSPELRALLLHWHWHPGVLGLLGVLAALYGSGWRRLRRHGSPASRRLASAWRLAAYLGGLLTVALALLSPLGHLSELLFSAHMVQHQLLLMAAPPLLLLGNPFPIVLWGVPRRARRRIGAWLTRGSRLRAAWRFATWMPVAGLLYAANLWGWHHPAAYEAALAHPAVHALEHLGFFGTALLFWWPVVNPAPRLRPLERPLQYGLRIAYLVLATAQNTLLGAILGLSERVLYASYAAAPRVLGLSPLDDQAFGGGVMWSGSHMYLIAILVLIGRALDAEGRRKPAPAEAPRSAV